MDRFINQVINDDCLNILPQIPSNSIDLILTDPPYMISSTVKIRRQRNPMKFDKNSSLAVALRERKQLKKTEDKDYKYKGKDISFEFGDWDIFSSLKDYLKFSKQWFFECIRVLKKGGHIVSFWDKHKLTYLVKWAEKLDVKSRQCLFWVKSNPVPCARKVNFMSGIEMAYWGCLTPGHRILTKDLQWVPIENLKQGDDLIGFTENCNKKGFRHFRQSKILANKPIKKNCYKLYLSDGTTLIASEDHPFLRRAVRGNSWITPQKIQSWWNSKKYLKGKLHFDRILPTWDNNNSYEAGYLAGMFDGDGCLVQKVWDEKSYKHHGIKLEIAQKENEALKTIIKYLELLNFNYDIYKNKPVWHIWIKGNIGQILKCLGEIRPSRLLAKFNPNLLGALHFRKEDRAYLENIEYVGEKIVCGLETSTKTYIAEGFPCHNTKITTQRKFATFNYQLGQHTDYFQYPIVSPNAREDGKRIHPTQKPIKMIKKIISYLSNPDDIILDPFAGSGTTLAGAKSLGRKFIGIEKEEKYTKFCKERLSQQFLDLPVKKIPKPQLEKELF